MSDLAEFRVWMLTLINLGVFALNLKLYTEWWKERVKHCMAKGEDEIP